MCGLKSPDTGNFHFRALVTPFMGVWIEIEQLQWPDQQIIVTPFMGVWIEITFQWLRHWMLFVTPFMGVWIEIVIAFIAFVAPSTSHPLWVCGLK